MSYRRKIWAFGAFAIAGLISLVGCEKDLLQSFFHPSADYRFAESTSGTWPAPTPVAVNPTQFKFAVFGDIHTQADGSSRLAQFTADVRTRGITFFLVLGDLTEDGTAAEMATVKAGLDNVGVPYYTTIGNHDLFRGGDEGGWNTWKTTFGPTTYSVTLGNALRFIFIDTANGELGAAQFNWLESQLATSVPNTFVCSHFGVFDGTEPHLWRLESAEERYKLSSLMVRTGVFGYLAGHLHAFNHTRVGNIEHFEIGNMYPGNLDFGKHGYTLFTWNAGTITWQNIELD